MDELFGVEWRRVETEGKRRGLLISDLNNPVVLYKCKSTDSIRARSVKLSALSFSELHRQLRKYTDCPTAFGRPRFCVAGIGRR